jgi:hypothetical protein
MAIDNVPLRKLYLEVFGFNVPVLRMLRKLGVHEEMCRGRHRFWNGEYWDQHGFTMYREDVAGFSNRVFGNRRIRHVPLCFGTREKAARVGRNGESSAASHPRKEHVTDEVIESLFSPAP